MSPDLERLVQLQQLDTRIEEAKRTIASHPEREAAVEARLNEAAEALERAKQRLKECQDARRALEKDAALYQGRVEKFKDQLFAVKTNKEYLAVQHEIATAQQELSAVEERVLERMLEADDLGAEVKQAEAALAAGRKAAEAERARLAEELTANRRTLDETTARRGELAAQLDSRLVALYEQVSRMRKGVAICAATHDGLCSVCHVRLRPHVFQQVRHNDSIIQCESCHRILYYVPPPAPVTPPTIVTS